LRAGLNLNLIVSIDFTASNGLPTQQNSLHYIGTNDNEYSKCIRSVSKILLLWDNDKIVPVYG